MKVVFGNLWSLKHKKKVSETEDFVMTSFSVLDISNGEQRKLLTIMKIFLNIQIESFQLIYIDAAFK